MGLNSGFKGLTDEQDNAVPLNVQTLHPDRKTLSNCSEKLGFKKQHAKG